MSQTPGLYAGSGVYLGPGFYYNMSSLCYFIPKNCQLSYLPGISILFIFTLKHRNEKAQKRATKFIITLKKYSYKDRLIQLNLSHWSTEDCDGHDRSLYIGCFKENLKIHTGVPPLLSFRPSPPLPSSPSPLSPPFLYPLPLEVGPLKCSYGVWGSAVSSPSGVWDGAPAEIDFGAF